jgi:hypothetical protein
MHWEALDLHGLISEKPMKYKRYSKPSDVPLQILDGIPRLK